MNARKINVIRIETRIENGEGDRSQSANSFPRRAWHRYGPMLLRWTSTDGGTVVGTQ